MEFLVIILYAKESIRLKKFKQNPYLKTINPRVRALGFIVLVFSHGFSKRIEHIEDSM